jgi:mevalonate kinase
VTAAIPLRTRVTAWRASGPSGLVLSSSAPIYRTQPVVARAVVAGQYRGEVLEHMQAAARVSVSDPAKLPGLVISAQTELPVAAGVASSAAVTLAACGALTDLDGGPSGDVDHLCELAYLVESDELEVSAGWMDYLACAHGGVNAIEGGSRPQATRISDALATSIVLVDTLERRSTKSVLAGRRAQLLGRDPALMIYISRMTELVGKVASQLTASEVDLQGLGALLNEAQDLLARQACCSTELIDSCIERVLAAGAYGAKLTGYGYGGCLFALVADDAIVRVLTSLQGLPVHAQVLPGLATGGITIETCSAPAVLAREVPRAVDRIEPTAVVANAVEGRVGSTSR